VQTLSVKKIPPIPRHAGYAGFTGHFDENDCSCFIAEQTPHATQACPSGLTDSAPLPNPVIHISGVAQNPLNHRGGPGGVDLRNAVGERGTSVP
jgi:hypothetical protein